MTTATALRLRDYQREAIDTVFAEADNGVLRQLVVMATGLGKTATAINLAREYAEHGTGEGLFSQQPKRQLWLTHRDELVQQTVAALDLWWPEMWSNVGIVKADINELDKPFVIASVQTLAVESRRNALIASQLQYGAFGLVISDEHHHSPSPTWAAALDALGCGEHDGPLMLGLTATPNRSDGVGLKSTTDKIVFERDIVWAVSNGYLVPPKGITVDVDLGSVKVSGGDYQAGSLGDVMEVEGAHVAVAELITRFAKDRKTIVFTPTVRFAELVAAECVLAGHVAEMVSGETPLTDRRAMYARLRSGETRVVVNCMVLTEGFDEPSVDCIVVARPTRSESLFTQMVGRGLRLYPAKEDCLVIALAGTERHKLATLASLAGRSYAAAMKARELAEQGVFDFAEQLDAIIAEEAKRAGMKAREIDLMAAVRKRIAWGVINDTTFAKKVIAADRDDKTPQPVIVIKRQSTRQEGEKWKVVKMVPRTVTRNGKAFTDYSPEVMIADVEFETAQGLADDTIRRLVPRYLLDKSAPWRSLPASPAQLEQLRKNNVPHIAKNTTRGMASDMLDTVFLHRIASRA